MKSILPILLTLSIPLLNSTNQAFAAQERGGGNAVVCFKDKQTTDIVKTSIANNGWIPDQYVSDQYIRSVDMLDIFEAKGIKASWKNPDETKLIEVSENESIDDIYKRIFDRTIRITPAASYYLEQGEKGLKEIRFSKHGLVRMDDISQYEFKENEECIRVTIMLQVDEGKNSFLILDKRFFQLSDDIFSKLNKAAARVHEYIYYYARKFLDASTSDKTRRLTGALFLNEITMIEMSKELAMFEGKDSEQYRPYTFIAYWGSVLRDQLKAAPFFSEFATSYDFHTDDQYKNGYVFTKYYSKSTSNDEAFYDCQISAEALRIEIKNWFLQKGFKVIDTMIGVPHQVKEEVNKLALELISSSEYYGSIVQAQHFKDKRKYSCKISVRPIFPEIEPLSFDFNIQ